MPSPTDTQAPVLKGLQLPTITVSTGAATATFGASANDVGSGVAQVRLVLDHPLMSGGGAQSSITFGDWSAGTSASVMLPIDASTIAGTYQIVQAIVTDAASNTTSYTGSGLQAVGIASAFTVQSNTPTDTVAPTLASLSATSAVAVGGAGSATLTVGAQDGGAGVRDVVIQLDHSLQTANGAVSSLVLSDAADSFVDGTSSLTQTLNAATGTGTYNFTSVTLTDKVGNAVTYDAAALANYAADHPGVATSLTIQDKTPPVLTHISLPTTIDVSQGTVPVTFSATATDAGGISYISLSLRYPGALIADNGFTLVAAPGVQPDRGFTNVIPVRATEARSDIALVSHPRTDPYPSGADSFAVSADVYSVIMPITALTHGGAYEVFRATVYDLAGNGTVYEGAQLAALGPTTFSVKGDEAPPVLTSIGLIDTIIAPDQPLGFVIGVSATDVANGLASVSAMFDRPVSMLAPIYGGGPSNVLTWSANAYDLTPATVANLASATPVQPGTYHLTGLTLADRVGNAISYTGTQLAALGYDTDIVIGHPRPGDFGGDAHSDVLWINRNGALSTWSANSSGGLIQSTYNAAVDPSWHVVETFDWNGDARSDVLWRNDNGAVAIWNGTANGLAQAAYSDQVGTNWKIVASGNFNADAKADILWQNSDGALSDWLSTGDGFTKNVWSHTPVGGGWSVAGVGDFDGNGTDDIVWRNANGAVSTWNSANQIDAQHNSYPGFAERSTLIEGTPTSWHIVGVGDFNGDGKSDLLWRNDNGNVSAWQGTGNDFAQGLFNAYAAAGWHVAQIGDFNGDGLSDILWRNDGGQISIWQSTGAGWSQNTYSDGSVGYDWTIAAHAFPV